MDTIRYLDSYFQGGKNYANAMKKYLEDFERTIGKKQQQPWTCISTTQRRSYEDATHIYVPRQLGGDDCGVYACIFADLISQKRQISEAEHGWINNAREQLQKQLSERSNHKTTPDLQESTRLDNYTSYTSGTGNQCAGKEKEEGQ